MSLENSTIAVTGSGGFIGRHLCRALAAKGAAVRALVRYRSDLPGDFQFDLSQNNLQPEALKAPVRAVVHCAWDVKARELADARSTNVEGTRWLIERCLKDGVEQCVFISSLAADAESRSVFGITKWEAEKYLLAIPTAATFSTVIAAGMVVGNGGAFLKARARVKKSPMIPIVYGSGERRIQTVHLDELCNAIIASIENRVTGRFCVAENDGVSRADFYRGLAMLEGRQSLMIPFPGEVVMLGVRMMEAMGFQPGTSSRTLLEMKRLYHVGTSESIAKLGCGPLLNYWQSLEKLASAEGKPDAAKKIAAMAV